MESRKLTTKEISKVKMVFEPVGGFITGCRYSGDTYYLGIYPHSQATPQFRRTLEEALGTDRIVINGLVKV